MIILSFCSLIDICLAYSCQQFEDTMFSIFRSLTRQNESVPTSSQPCRNRRLRLEPLEERQMLSVSVGEFNQIRELYPDLNLSANMADYNIILLVPTALKVPAEMLMKSVTLNETTHVDPTTKESVSKPATNPHMGKFEWKSPTTPAPRSVRRKRISSYQPTPWCWAACVLRPGSATGSTSPAPPTKPQTIPLGDRHSIPYYYVQVPEPATMSLLALGAVGLLRRYRRR